MRTQLSNGLKYYTSWESNLVGYSLFLLLFTLGSSKANMHFKIGSKFIPFKCNNTKWMRSCIIIIAKTYFRTFLSFNSCDGEPVDSLEKEPSKFDSVIKEVELTLPSNL